MHDITDYLDQRRGALENAFFRKQDEELRERLRAKATTESLRAALSAASGVTDAAILDELIEANITPESLAALAIVPLVAVAWADGKMEDREREAILMSASEFGISTGHHAYVLLQGWLAVTPPAELLRTWKDYIGAIAESMNPDALQTFRKELIGRATGVAESAGGFLGLGQKISDVERKVLDELDAAFG
jgi:hypothetical protein